MLPSPISTPENIHPSLWRASQLARGIGETVDSGYAALSAELPGAGWPKGALTEILIEHQGTAELRLLQPALASLRQGHIIFLQAPFQPQIGGMAELGLNAAQLLWIRTHKPVDALWAAEHILRSGSCSALLYWQSQMKNEALRRLHLAAQSGRTLFCMIRPLAFAQTPSPAPLRLSLKTTRDGLQIDFIKRRGHQRDSPLHISLPVPLCITKQSTPTPLSATVSTVKLHETNASIENNSAQLLASASLAATRHRISATELVKG